MTIDLTKISLTKSKQSINLAKNQSFADILINLNWSSETGKKSFFGFGKPKKIDLDVGCLFELKDGQTNAIQALGDAFGDYDVEPYIELMGDDRSGDNADGETIRINGAQWNKIKRVLVYAFIYEGVTNWAETDGVVTVTVAGQSPVEVRMDNGDNGKNLCGIVLLENDESGVKVTRLVEYHSDQSVLDRAHNWGLHWGHGSK